MVILAAAVVLTLAGCRAVAPPPAAVDRLTVSLDDVRTVTENESLTESADASEPSPGVAGPPPECRTLNDQRALHGTDWIGFRSVTYAGDGPTARSPRGFAQLPPAIVMVTQTLAVYSDDASARAALERVATAAKSCDKTEDPTYQMSVTRAADSTIAVNHEPGDWGVVYRREGTVVIEASVLGVPDTAQVAEELASTIAGRVP